jgi:GDP-4-dehydro-6-deoxy-D-mannose reductase
VLERVLVTGAVGFVGRHLRDQLGDSFHAFEGDVLDAAALAAAVRDAQPGSVVHLAAESSVAASWENAAHTWSVNVVGTVNVLEAAREAGSRARVLFASTGDVYGRTDELPTPESAPVRPLTPYAAAKAAAEVACGQYVRQGLDVVVARGFSQEGPGRDERFALGSWTQQIARLEESGGGVLEVGDLSPERDICDVRDVCRAYTLMLDEAVEAGTYNVASGRSVPMSRLVELLVSLARCRVEVLEKPQRLRPVEIPRMLGDPTRLREVTGWRPEIPLEQTVADTLEAARVAVRVA